ncbi:Hsp20/alpha crystallin family protein [Mailhella sp.]|uniref:Hsp20/alpha crystallin family protein n=1 Tax=Mailhella sp. TaxID=1981029 RepID=UPI0040644BA1
MSEVAPFPLVRPAADIMDAEDGIRIVANMPGVRSEDLHLQVERDSLHIHASSRCPSPMTGGRDLRNLEFGSVEFELDIAMDRPLSAPPVATLSHGVLSVFLPGEQRRDVHVLK